MVNSPKPPLLSVCVCHRSRSWVMAGGERRPLFRRGFDVLCATLREVGVPAEIVIVDWPDPLCPELGLGDWVRIEPPPEVRVIDGQGEFTRGGGRNQAARAARGRILAFIDADMLAPSAVIRRGLEVAREGKAFFPFYVRRRRDGSAGTATDGVGNKGVGTGNAILSRDLYDASDGFPEGPEWGGEDTKFSRWFGQRGLAVREPVPGFVHQWHGGGGGGGPRKGGGWRRMSAVRINPYATHVSIVAACAARATGPVLELGMGFYSTPLLHALCAVRGVRLVSVESNERYLARFAGYARPGHRLVHAEDPAAWLRTGARPQWGFAFIDNAQGERIGCLAALKERGAVLVAAHDTEPANEKLYQYEPTLSAFAHRFDYRAEELWTAGGLCPSTTVVSDVDDLAWLREIFPPTEDGPT